MPRPLSVAIAPLCAAAVLAPAAAPAQTSDDWKFQAILYGYLPSVGGTTTFAGSGGGSNVNINGSKLLSLNFVFMGSLEASKGPWGVFTDVMYIDVGHDKSHSRDILIGGVLPADVTASIDYNMRGWVWTLAGTWRAVAAPTYKLDVLGGARLLDVAQTLDWQLSGNVGPVALPDRAGHRDASRHDWDAIVGVKGRALFGDTGKWFVPYYVDVGTGQSKFTWQAFAGAGYSFGWGDVVGVWRYIGYDMKSGKAIESVNLSGPAIGAVFRW